MNPAAALAHNLVAGLFASLGLRSAARRLHPSAGQLVALVALQLGVAFGYDWSRVGADGQFNVYALPVKLFPVFGLLLAAWFASALLRRPRRLLPAAVAMASTLAAISLLLGALALASPNWWTRLPTNAMNAVWWLVWVWPAVAGAVAGARAALDHDAHDAGIAVPAGDAPAAQTGTNAAPGAGVAPGAAPARRVMAAVGAAALLTAPAWMLDHANEPLWIARPASGEAERWEAPATEAVLYEQPRLLDEALAAVPAGIPGRPELFYIGFAGYGRQNVFLNEVVQVERLLSDRFALGGRGIVLANHPSSALQRPFATVAALQRALAAIARKMNPDEDVLLLFLTSHGAHDHKFEIDMWPYRFEPLTPALLGAALDRAGVRHAVIVVSACYSGGFVPPLASPDRLVIAASRADRNSFGCSDGADWTYFGRAYFAEALRETTSFEDAFALAQPRIAERERREGFVASEPQVAAGAAIRARLQALQAQLAR
jgi:hypothetical protein